MIGYGVCIGSEERYQEVAVPGLALCIEAGSPVAETRDNDSIFRAYNSILEHFASVDDLEALVLLHEDVELRDAELAAKLRTLFADPSVGVVGVVGATQVQGLAWWDGACRGRCAETRGLIDFGGGIHDVEVVDGLLLALSPWCVRNLRFDEERFGGFHGYDADICLQARAAGKRTLVTDIELFHHTKGGYGDTAAFVAADGIFCRKWGFQSRFDDTEAATSNPAAAAAAAAARADRHDADAPEARGSGGEPAAQQILASPEREESEGHLRRATSATVHEAPGGTELVDRLEIGGGMLERPGWANLDPVHGVGMFRRCLQQGIPVPDATLERVRASHVMEHIGAEHRVTCMNEVHRALKPGGLFEIIVPLFPSWPAIADPTHVSYWVEQSFWYFTGQIVPQADYGIRYWKWATQPEVEHYWSEVDPGPEVRTATAAASWFVVGGYEGHAFLVKPGTAG